MRLGLHKYPRSEGRPCEVQKYKMVEFLDMSLINMVIQMRLY
jgi:hypothetical protein